MLLISKIEFLDVDVDVHTIFEVKPWEPLPLKGGEMVEAKVAQELVRGRRFRRPNDGMDIVIGCSKQAQDVIGLQYEAWESLENDRDYWHTQCVASRLKIESIKQAGFWKRLKWLLRGYR